MSDNPYSAQTTQTADFGSGMPAGPAKTSTLAIVAFVLALISIVGCCVPGLPALAALLGVFAIIGIGRSNGRLTGNGFAIAALVIGILMSVIQTVAWIGMRGIASQFNQLNASVEAIEANDYASARSQFPNVPADVLTDERIAEFRAAYTADAGAFQSSPESMLSLMSAYVNNGDMLQQMQQPNWPYPNETIPWPASFANGDGFMLFIPDESAADSGVTMPLSNLGVAAPSGSVYWLIPPGGGALPGTPDSGQLPAGEGDAADEASDAPAEEPAEGDDQPAGDGG